MEHWKAEKKSFEDALSIMHDILMERGLDKDYREVHKNLKNNELGV